MKRCNFCVYMFCQVVQEHYSGEVGIETSFWLPNLFVINVQKIIEVGQCLFKLQLKMSGISFWGHSVLWSIASSMFNLRAWKSFCITSLQVFFGLPLGVEPSTSYSIHFFTQSLSSFHNTCPYHRNLFCCSTNIMSPNPSLVPNSLLGTLSFTIMSHIHLTILISACWSATSFSFLTDQVSLPCNIPLHTQLLYSLPLIIPPPTWSSGRRHSVFQQKFLSFFFFLSPTDLQDGSTDREPL